MAIKQTVQSEIANIAPSRKWSAPIAGEVIKLLRMIESVRAEYSALPSDRRTSKILSADLLPQPTASASHSLNVPMTPHLSRLCTGRHYFQTTLIPC